MTNYVMEAFYPKRFKKNSKMRLKKLLEIYRNSKKQIKSITSQLEARNTVQSIIAYPQTDKQELASIMKLLNLKYVKIAKTPWKKELIGIVRLSDLEKSF